MSNDIAHILAGTATPEQGVHPRAHPLFSLITAYKLQKLLASFGLLG